MRLGQFGFLVIILAICTVSPKAFSSGEDHAQLFFTNGGDDCSRARRVYDNLIDKYFEDVGYSDLNVIGNTPQGPRVILKLRSTRVLGSGGFGPSGWIYYYHCAVEQY